MLRKFYEKLKSNGNEVEIIFVSGDKSEQEFQDYFRNDHGDWLAVDYNAKERTTLSDRYQVKGIPTLIVVNGKGENVVPNAREHVRGASDDAAVQSAFLEWKKVAGDWRETAGATLGGSVTSAPKDAAALRAARLAALEGRKAPAEEALPAASSTATSQADAEAKSPAPAIPVEPAQEVASTEKASLDAAGDAKVAQLTNMGFTVEQAQQALSNTSGDVEQAVNLLLASVGD